MTSNHVEKRNETPGKIRKGNFFCSATEKGSHKRGRERGTGRKEGSVWIPHKKIKKEEMAGFEEFSPEFLSLLPSHLFSSHPLPPEKTCRWQITVR